MKLWIVVSILVCVTAGPAVLNAADSKTHVIGRFKEAPKIDGVLEEWGEFNPLKMSQPNVKDHKVDKAYVAWDQDYIYAAMSLHDTALVNDKPARAIQYADCFEIRIARSANQGKVARYLVAPTSKEEKPTFCVQFPNKTSVEDTTGVAENGVKWAVKIDGKVWSIEIAIPAKLLKITPKVDATFPFVVVVWDRDRTDINEWEQWWKRSEFGNQKSRPSRWPKMLLKDEAPKQSAKATVKQKRNAAKLTFDVPRHKPCNLFTPGQKLVFTAFPNGPAKGQGKLQATITDYFGKTVAKQTLAFQMPAKEGVELPFEYLPRGYFELNLKANVQADNGKTVEGVHKVCFAIADMTHRSASEARQGGYRFGMKMYYLQNAWWAGNVDWDEREVVDAISKLGMQWTRVLMQQTWHLATEEIVKAFPMNGIFKVERFPKELYDEARYGPIKEFERKYGRGSWTLKTLPRKKPYQAWLKQVLQTLPPEQNVFEIWNEAWDKMSAEDLATISNWITDVILSERPNAIIGANLRGSTSKYEYDTKFIDAGGMKGMKMVALHPYSEAEDRQWLRDYRQWVSEKVGRPIDIYVTEYGSHSCPEGPAKRSENEQAQRVVHQSLALYAEDVKALTPHWAGQREQNPRYHEHWFGFIRLNHDPKPALIAHAVSGRMVDASRYVGDLKIDQQVEAMLFDRNGEYTLAIWTRQGEKAISFDPGVSQLTLVDMVGKQIPMQVKDNKLQITASTDLLYLVGVSPKLESQATTKLDPLRWATADAKVRVTRTLPRTMRPIVADGKIDEWDKSLQLYMTNPKVNGKDASGHTYMSWDEKNLYIAVNMRDNEMLNKRSLNKIYQQDSIELFVSTEPRDKNPGYGPNDFQFMITPTSMLGKPLRVKVTDREAGKMADVPGDLFYAGKTRKGWVAEFAIPWSQFNDFTPKVGGKIALEIRVNDADTSHERWKIDPDGVVIRPSDPSLWSHLILK